MIASSILWLWLHSALPTPTPRPIRQPVIVETLPGAKPIKPLPPAQSPSPLPAITPIPKAKNPPYPTPPPVRGTAYSVI